MADSSARTEEQEAAEIMKQQEEKLRKKYSGSLPIKKGLLGGDRKYFDSADWAKDRAKTKAAQGQSDESPTQATDPQNKPADDELLPPPPPLTNENLSKR